ncbi:non-ribosomal peptide synthetase [Rhizobium sp.]|jgi:polyketide synthase PksJ|uniref:non-ribosomal peptide synthetase n=1 Tax=Rhizobium sp. TaxID=391 RepID=UPI000E7D9592|nr:hypothetical protein [Rhizobium sp.]
MTDWKRAQLDTLMRQAVASERHGQGGIAIIGLAGRYPGAENVQQLWSLIQAGRTAIREVPPERWNADLHYDADGKQGKSYSKWAGFIEGADTFDPLFFQISPLEAENMDPQERLFVQTAWTALEDAGYTRRQMADQNPVGVFVGAMNSDYHLMAGEASARGILTEAGSSPWSIANRVSHILDLKGPSLALDTACSASLTAIHLACQSLRLQECKVAIAGGVNLILHPSHMRVLAARGMISHSDQCRSFGEGADGFVAGEGVGAVILKPLLQAVMDGDRIYGVIRGSAINSGGRSSGYTVPRTSAQADVIEAALRQARIDPRTISYVEAHGTGTPLGDPIEIAGLSKAFAQGHDPEILAVNGTPRGEIALGSLKSNIGHLESAAGIAGLTKVLLQFQHGQIAPSLHADVLNPEISLEDSPFSLCRTLIPWQPPRLEKANGEIKQVPLRAGISSFGGGGANAHLIVESYSAPAKTAADVSAAPVEPQLIVLSARTQERLTVYAANLAVHVAELNKALPDQSHPYQQEAVSLQRLRSMVAEMAAVRDSDLLDDLDLSEYGFTLAEFTGLSKIVAREADVHITPEDMARAGTLQAMVKAMTGPVQQPVSSLNLHDLAYALQTTREPMAFRLAFMASDGARVQHLLESVARGEQPESVLMGQADPTRRMALSSVSAEAVKRKDWSELAKLWVEGADIAWEQLHPPKSRRRIALPTYPFENKSYWLNLPQTIAATSIDPTMITSPTQDQPLLTPNSAASDALCYQPVWEPINVQAGDARMIGRVVIVHDDNSAGLASTIAAHHATAVVEQLSVQDPRLADKIADLDSFDRAYYLPLAASPAAVQAIGDAVDQRLLPLFDLAQKIGSRPQADRAVDLRIVTRGAFSVHGEPVENPLGAGVHALARVIAKERPNTHVQCIDFPAILSGGETLESWLNVITTTVREGGGETIAVRAGQTYRWHLGKTGQLSVGSSPFRHKGVYVIVGGNGGIGQLLSHELAVTYQARLVWISRGVLSPQAKACMDLIRKIGGDIIHVQADCSRLDDLNHAADLIERAFGPIHGVIHSAMTFDDRLLTAQSRRDFRQALATKVDGTHLIDQAFGSKPLDFMLFFSSVGALGAAAGNGAYSASSSIQDAYAHMLAARRTYPVRVINWGYWGNVGSGGREGLAETFKALGIDPLDPHAALSVLPAVLSNPHPQILAIEARPDALKRFGLSSQALTAKEDGVFADLTDIAVDQATIDAMLARYDRLIVLAEYGLLGALRRMGIFRRGAERHNRQALFQQLGIIETYRRLFDAALNVLAQAGYVQIICDDIETTARVSECAERADGDGWLKECNQIAADMADVRSTAKVTSAVLSQYPEILRGKISAMEVLFPGGSSHLMEGLYRDNVLADTFNHIVAHAVRHNVQQRMSTLGPQQKIRIIEFGAGTGSTTRWVLEALAAFSQHVDYVYTDLSKFFLDRGAAQFAEKYDFVTFKLLDLECDAQSQDYEASSFDLVIATNVIHATRRIDTSLALAKQLLVPGGWVIINEFTRVTPLLTLSGGVLEGWWRFADEENRLADSPICSLDAWRRVLQQAGFSQPLLPGAGTRDLGQHVLLAQSGVAIDAAQISVPSNTMAGQAAVVSSEDPSCLEQTIETVELQDDIREIGTIIAEVLKLGEEIAPDRRMSDYGLDSLVGLRVADALQTRLKLTIKLSDFFVYPTLNELARYIASLRPQLPRRTLPEAVAQDIRVSASVKHGPVTRPAFTHPLSIGQKALADLERVEPGTRAYIVPFALNLNPTVNISALHQALQTVVDGHEQLRAILTLEMGEPVWLIQPQQAGSFEQRDLSRMDAAVALETMRHEAGRVFDLYRGPLLRAVLFHLPVQPPVLLLCFHHIVIDGLSFALVLEQVQKAYAAHVAGRPAQLAAPGSTYGQFVAWQAESLSGQQGERDAAYWREQLEGQLVPQALPYDHPRKGRSGLNGASLEGVINADLTRQLRAFAGENGASLSSVTLSAYLVLLYRFSLSEAATIGVVTAGRPVGKFTDVVGYFANLMILHTAITPDQDFRTLLKQVHGRVLSGLEHANLPLPRLLTQLAQNGQGPLNDILRAAYYFQGWLKTSSSNDLIQGPFAGIHQEGEFDLTLDVIDGGETLGFTLKYDRELFFEATIVRLRDYLIAMLQAVVSEPERSIATLPLLPKEAATHMVNPLPPTFAQVAPFKSVYQLFADQAAWRPQSLAVQCGDQTLRYSDLARRVDQLCHLLISRGAGNGQIIGIFVERSVDMVVSLFAVMKAGAAYVPLDPVYPANRIAHILEDCKPKLIITTQALEPQLGSTSVPRLPLESVPLENMPPQHNNLPVAQPAPVDENTTAYIIYTSGSTGLPKGVEVTHGGLANILLSMQQNPGFSTADRLFAVTTICFDIAAVELYLPLISGGSLVVAGSDDLSDGRSFRKALETSVATVVQATPSAWKMLLATGWQGDPALNIWTGGEAIDQNTADALLTRGKSLWNLYGPTETTIWSMLSRYQGNAVPTIGRAADKTALMILNEQLEPVAPGLPGELCIGGAGVARGYYNKPELTGQRFVFVRQADGSSMRMFRTGDLVRMLGNGEIQYLERIDNQVKIRGYRVELGEIENVMRRQPGVRDAAVVLAKSESADGVVLRGFYVADRILDPSMLQQNLPGYMIPAVLQRLEALPRLPNGKTDRGRLATMELDDIVPVNSDHQVAMQSAAMESGNLEQTLFEIVAQSAGVPLEKVRLASRFGELGLSSVGLTVLSEKLSQVFGMTLSPTAFYAHPSVEALARHISTLVPSDTTVSHAGLANPSAEERDRLSSPVAAGATAIIGMAGRLPQSPDLSTFWDHITAGHDLLEEIPASRWDWRISESERGRWGGFITDVDLFDAAFFGISPREAALMDPQQRLLLETAWAAIENAGYAPGQLAGKRVGVFIGLTNSDYLEVQKAAGQSIQPHTLTGAALSIIPNRLSYLMDFRGPSLAVDTACSSALTAIYQAVNALRRGDCDLAIAGAVNLILMPTVHETLSKNEMLSEDGRCKPFDRRANGYARGEGIGAIVLKGLEAAIRDRDPIQAVIRGVAINHGGKSASLTAPNPNAQAEVIRAALSDGDVEADTISYIEAHGTGTALGDPIEVDGLNQVFAAQASSQDGVEKILIGSVKSNIGHLEAAAALAGLFKLVLSLKHGRIPGTVHLQDPNPLLDFTTNRLALVSQTRDWPVRYDPQGRAYPRRAGLSSFGFGGANGHLVLEEWMKTPEPNTDLAGKPLLFVVSARDRAALVRQVAGLAAFLNSKSQGDLASVAATLQFGRDAMAHRLAIVAASHAALVESLQGFVEQGDVLADPAAFSAVVSDASGQAARKPATESLIKMLTREGNLYELAQLFVAGEEIDWNLLYPGTVPARIALPSYPFERTRHWVKGAEGTVQQPADSHFQLVLTGQESFLRDHVVAGQQVFPGVGSLLLALKVARFDRGTSFRLENLIWVAPVLVPVDAEGAAVPLTLKLSPKPDGLSFELFAGEDMRQTASAGLVRRLDQPYAALEKTSLVSVLKRCPRQVSGQDFYARLVTLGVSYGDSFRIVDWLALGEHEALAELKPLTVPEDATQFLVSPAILDAPLQIAGLMMAGLEGPARDSAIPFSLQDITGDRARLPLARYVLVEKTGERLFNARFLSEDGEVVGALNAMQFRGMRSPKISGDPSQTEGREAALFQPVWRDARAITASRSQPQRLLVLDGAGDADTRLANAGFGLDIIDLRTVDEQALFDRIETIVKAAGRSLAVVHLPAQNGVLSECVTTGFDAALTACRALITARAGGLPYLYLYAEQGGDAGLANATHAAMIAFAHSLRAETPAVDFKVVAHAPTADMRFLLTECFSIAEHVVALRLLEGRRQIRAWEPISANTLTSKWSPRSDDGVYLITGGTGAIGLQLAEWLLRQSTHAKIVLSSRHEPSPAVKAHLDLLNEVGSRVAVIAADVTKRQEVHQLMAQLRVRFGSISGVFHAAGVSDDGFILKKHRASADAVLAPKLYGLTYLDEATRNDDLACFVAFSSTAAVFGNVGQADYAFANAFMDHAMQWRRGLVEQGLRRGFSLSINWPFWGQGGFQLPPGHELLMKSTFGLEPLSSDAGLQALERALACDNSQVLVGSGDPQRLLSALNAGLQKPIPKVEMQPRVADAAADKTHQLGKALAALFTEELQLSAQEIDPALPLDGYGVDSFLSLSITRRLEDVFGTLPKTLLFEYVTLGDLTGFLAGKDNALVDAAIKAFSGESIDPTEEDPVFEPQSDYYDHSPSMPLASLSSAVSEPVNKTDDDDDIAIIGISGRFPQADTLQEFWRNLESGKDSIETIPSERWNQEDYFDPEPGKPGKSYSKWGGFLKDIDRFDPMFFRMAQMEAEHIDPQERLFLQTVWHLLEDAGVTRQNLAQQKTGVFVGMMYGHYQLHGVQEALQGLGVATSSSYASVANRVSYFFNFNGPSIALDSMCSSALSSIHLAALSIRAGDCDVAIAGGVNVSSHPLKYVQLSRSGFLSRDGRCRSFGEGGSGYVPAEGVGAVLLKRLGAAKADGDRILAVVKASTLNHGGTGKGYSAPNPRAQGDLIAEALDRAGLAPDEIDYIEAHGTGTSLGDPIEIAGLQRAFERDGKVAHKIPIGSVKSNIGHAESAAGMAALSKVLLQFEHNRLAPSLHAETLNGNIDFVATPFEVQREARDWPRPLGRNGKPRARNVAISSFGAGGANAHVIVQEYIADEKTHVAVPPYVFALSVKDPEALSATLADFAAFLRHECETVDPASLAWTLQVGREAFAHRFALVFDSIGHLLAQLDQALAGQALKREALDPDRQDKAHDLARQWLSGASVDWPSLYPKTVPPRISLPGYAFRKDRCWLPQAVLPEPSPPLPPVVATSNPQHSASEDDVMDIRNLRDLEFELTVQTPIMAGHKVDGVATFPAVGYLDLILQQFQAAGYPLETLEIRNLTAIQPLCVREGESLLLAQCAVSIAENEWRVTIATRDRADQEPYASARVVFTRDRSSAQPIDVQNSAFSAQKSLPLDGIYDRDRIRGQDYSGYVRASGLIEDTAEAFIARLFPPVADSKTVILAHPALLMAGAVAAGIADQGKAGDGDAYLPLYIQNFRLFAPLNRPCLAIIRKESMVRKGDITQLDLRFVDEQGQILAELDGLASKLLQGQRRDTAAVTPQTHASSQVTAAQSRVRHLFARHLGRVEETLPLDRGYYEMGIDSAEIVSITQILGDEVGAELPPTLCFEHTNLRDLADHLALNFPAAFSSTSIDVPSHQAAGLLEQVRGSLDISHLQQTVQSSEVDRWIALALTRQLVSSGRFSQADVSSKYQRWFDEAAELMEAEGLVSRAPDGIVLTNLGLSCVRGELEPQAKLARARFAADPNWANQIEVVEHCLDHIGGVIRGEIQATDLLFSGGNQSKVMALLRDNPLAIHLNATLSAIVARAVEARLTQDGARTVRLAEAGAGTGSSTVEILPKIDRYAEQISYWYTDISPAFLTGAENGLGRGRDYLRYALWNIETSAGPDVIVDGPVDVMVAANVLHATRNIAPVLDHLAAGMRPGGLLILNEVTRKSAMLLCTFALLDGWWIYEDGENRLPGTPMLDGQLWERALHGAGFGQTWRPLQAPGAFAEIIVAQYGPADHPQPPQGRPQCLLKKDWQPAPATGHLGLGEKRLAILAVSATDALALRLQSRVASAEIITPASLPDVAVAKDFAAIVDLTGCSNAASLADFDGWLRWLQKLVPHLAAGSLLMGVTCGLEDRHGVLQGDAARRAALYRMLQSEYQKLRSRHVDLDAAAGIEDQIEAIIQELGDDGDDNALVYRSGQRLRSVMCELACAPSPAAQLTFNPQEVLWITGGTRGIGLAIARHAVRHWSVRRLLLSGRDLLPPRTEWRNHIHGPLAEKISAIQVLEALGAKVIVLSLPMDGTLSPSAMAQSVGEAEAELGTVSAVIHAAGTVDRAHLAFTGKPLAHIHDVLAPKTLGLDGIMQCVQPERLRFLALFSSVAAAMPALAVGQSDYTMANAYMDHVAFMQQDTLPIVSIQWPSWALGMGEAAPGPVYASTGLGVLAEAEGLALLEQILTQKLTGVVMPAVVADGALWQPEGLVRRRFGSTKAAAAQTTLPREDKITTAVPALTPSVLPDLTSAAENWVIDILAGLLHFDKNRLHRDGALEDYGVDSIMTTEIVQTIHRELQVEIDPSAILEHSHIGGFASWLVKEHGAALARRLLPEAQTPEVVSLPKSAPLNDTPKVTTLPQPERGQQSSTDIAIIGLSARFPGAATPEDYWQLIRDGKSAITRVPQKRWGRQTHHFAGLIDDFGFFDPDYFLMSPQDVAAMDPQALLVMEEAIYACCDAGYRQDELRGREIGVYVGGRTKHAPSMERLQETRNPVVVVGQNYLATNISRFLDLRGPSLVIDSACSSALTAMSSAVSALRAGDIEMAMVAGVSLLSTDEGHEIFGQRGILATSPEFHAFDQRGSGFVPSEGAGVVLLKPLAQARADGDRIRAVIKGIAVNNDGRTVGPASPNLAAQKAVMQKALKQSGLNAEDVVYIETNASGSATTDLVELKAIRDVYRPQAKGFPLNLGSVKPNIGHTLCSEAMAAIIKVVLMLEHAQLVPFLSGQQSLPHFDMRDAGMVFPRQVGDWPAPLLAAAVSSFADGGTNTHAILAAADPQDRLVAKRQPLPRPNLNRRDFSQPVLAAPVYAASSVRRDEPIAIIGMAGRYPGADDVAAFWDNLKRGLDSVTEVPPSRWSLPDTIARTASGKPQQSRYGGFLDDADKFDCDFFHISRPEADIMDPQERLFLQTAWEALEDAGHTPLSLTPDATDGRRKVGVFVGVMHKDYMLVGSEANALAADGQSWPLSINQGQIANRVSFALDLHGPSMAVDTLCSSSLTAVHLAVESLRAGESDAVIAGGVNLSLHKAKYETYGQVNMHSSDGRCRAFGTGGDGYVSSEGVGAFVLKRLSDAKASGDHIYAVIRASATNHVGRSSGFSVPNPVGQAAVIGDALDRSGLNARSIGYIEAHGTGTMLGDPVEVNGLTKAFRQHTDASGYCALGSVKSNIGHAESAAGIGSLTKTALQLHHKLLVPSLHADPVNPMLQLDKTPFRIQRDLDVWPAPKTAEGQDQPRRAGVSAFGATGSNVHIILEEYTEEAVYPQNAGADAHNPQLILLSARTQGQLHEQVLRLLHFIRTARQLGQVLRLADIAYTLRVGRKPQPVRWAGVVDNLQDLDGQLERASTMLSLTSDMSMATAEGVNKPANETQLSRWIETGDWQALAQHWMAGGALDRVHLPLNGQPKRISLPTYPFARIRHWIGQSEIATQQQAAPLKLSTDLINKTQSVDIRQVEIPVPAIHPSAYQIARAVGWTQAAISSPAQEPVSSRVLIVAPDGAAPLVEALKGRIKTRNRDAQVQTVQLAGALPQAHAAAGQGLSTAHSGWPEAVLASHGPIDALYVIAAGSGWQAQPQEPVAELALLRLINTLRARPELASPVLDCFVVTQDGDVDGGNGLPGLAYYLARQGGPFRVRTLELAGTPDGFGTMPDLARMIMTEPPSPLGEVFRLEGGKRLARDNKPFDQGVKPGAELRAGGRYVVIGGAGVVGNVITRYLCDQYQARVAWMGRRSANDPAVAALLNGFDPASRPLYLRADATQAEDIAAAIRQIGQLWGGIDGVIFAASDMRANNSPNAGLQEHEFRRIFAIKAEGAVNVYRAVADLPLDFLCFFSSAEAFAAAATHPAYSAGVSFADGYARSLAIKARFPVGVINWGGWQALLGDRASGLDASGFLSDEEACACLALSLSSLRAGTAGQVLCIRQPQVVKSTPVSKEPQAKSNVDRRAIVALMTKHLAKALRVGENAIVSHRNFSDQGVDSIVGMAFASDVGDALGVSLNGSVLYDYTSLDLLADHLVSRLSSAIPQPPARQASEGKFDFIHSLKARFEAGELSSSDILKLLDQNIETRTHL